MQVSTPISGTRLKKVHTPPSHGTNSPSSSRTFKKISGNVMDRVNTTFRSLNSSNLPSPSRTSHEERPRVVQTSSSRLCMDDDTHFGPSALPLTKPVMHVVKRRNTPAPLSLGQITPRPTPHKSHSSSKTTPRLQSPMDFRHSVYSSTDTSSWVTASGLDPRKRLDFNSPAGSHFALERQSRSPWEDLYPEVESPTYAAELRRNASKLSGPKNYVSSKCSICKEDLSFALSGEKLIELSCDHQCHFGCYLITFESHFPHCSFPNCTVCGCPTRPRSEDVLSEITAKILTRKSSESGSTIIEDNTASKLEFDAIIHPQVISASSEPSIYGCDTAQDFKTPLEQTIKSAEVHSDGFRTPYSSHGTPRKSQRTPNRAQFLRSYSSSLNKDILDEEFDLSKPTIKLTPQLSKFSVKEDTRSAIVQYVMTSHVPECPPKAYELSKEVLIRKEVDAFVESMLKLPSEIGSLEIFDTLSYSEDEDVWINVTALLFRECLIFTKEGNVIGHVSKDQISQVHQLDPLTLILNLKSRTLPEVFLCCEDDPAIVRKWAFHLKQIYLSPHARSAPLTLLTSNKWEFLPLNIANKIRHPGIQDLKASCSTDDGLNVLASQGQAPLKLIVCISILNCHAELHTNDQLLKILKTKLNQVLESLSSQDLVGLVVVGKDGSGQAGPYGTFLGMVRKDWDGWSELLDALEVYDNQDIFANDVWEMAVMMETSRKLMCTVEQEDGFIQQLVILGNDYSPNLITCIEDDLEMARLRLSANKSMQKYHFSVHHYFTCNSRLLFSDVVEGCFYNIKCQGRKCVEEQRPDLLVRQLQSRTTNSLSVTISAANPTVVQLHATESNGQLCKLPNVCSEVTMELGAMAPGESRNIVFEAQVDVQSLRDLLENTSIDKDMPLLQYTATWHDGSQRRVCQGRSMGCEFKVGTTNALNTPIRFSQVPIPLDHYTHNENETLEVALAPPMSATRDALFATRQIELTTLETLRSALAQFPYHTNSLLNQLVSVIFCVSRNCVCNDEKHYRNVSKEISLTDYVEKLCGSIEAIARQSVSGNGSVRASSRWQIAQLAAALACGISLSEWTRTQPQ